MKLGVSRQVVIPKKLHDRLGLKAGDYLEVSLERDRLVFAPKALIDKRIAEGLRDLRAGRTLGPFRSADKAMKALKRKTTRG